MDLRSGDYFLENDENVKEEGEAAVPLPPFLLHSDERCQYLVCRYLMSPELAPLGKVILPLSDSFSLSLPLLCYSFSLTLYSRPISH